MAKQKVTNEEPLEKQLWKATDKLRKNIDAAEYKHIVLGLIFLKYISDAFEVQYAKLQDEVKKGADPEDRDEYKADNVFFVPPSARWNFLRIAPNKAPSAKSWTMPWMQLKERTRHLKVYCPKYLPVKTSTPPVSAN